MNRIRLSALAAALPLLLAAPLSAQVDEHAIRQSSQISVLEMLSGRPSFYTVTIRTLSDYVIWRDALGREVGRESALALVARAYDVTPHSSGTYSIRLYSSVSVGLNGGTLELWSRNLRIDADRIRIF